MLWFALAIIFAIGFFIYYFKDDGFVSALVMFFFTLTLSSLVALCFNLACGALMQPHHYTKSLNVIAAQDGSGLHGNFSIFGGTINNTPMYFYYVQYPDGAIKQNRAPVDRATIYEDQTDRGYVVIHSARDYLGLFGLTDYRPDRSDTFELHVPKGSVDPSFKFDLRN